MIIAKQNNNENIREFIIKNKLSYPRKKIWQDIVQKKLQKYGITDWSQIVHEKENQLKNHIQNLNDHKNQTPEKQNQQDVQVIQGMHGELFIENLCQKVISKITPKEEDIKIYTHSEAKELKTQLVIAIAQFICLSIVTILLSWNLLST